MSSETTEQPIDESVLTTHEYDGIQEYDNPMPGWWTWIFIATIVWSGVYYVGLGLNIIPDYDAQLSAELELQRELKGAAVAETPPVTPEMLAEAVGDAERVTRGKQVYDMNCAACHGQNGEGLIGPNLADNAWIHGNELVEINRVVEEGVPAKGMPAWGEILNQDDMLSVLAYVDQLRGTDPPNAKAPEGKVYEEAPDGVGSEEPK